jgi:hypothetical protein
MLRVALCCVMIAATAAMADPWPWIPLESTPGYCPVGHDARITYGASRIWGVFPDSVSPTPPQTWLSYYPTPGGDPSGQEWSTPQLVPIYGYLYHTGLTFQWPQGGDPYCALYLIEDDNTGQTCLLWHPPTGGWTIYGITEFSLGDGACIVFAPNPAYGALYQVPGYIYCLPGNGTEFWRYDIDPPSHTKVQGLFPPDGSTIGANQGQSPYFRSRARARPGRLGSSATAVLARSCAAGLVVDRRAAGPTSPRLR